MLRAGVRRVHAVRRLRLRARRALASLDLVVWSGELSLAAAAPLTLFAAACLSAALPACLPATPCLQATARTAPLPPSLAST